MFQRAVTSLFSAEIGRARDRYVDLLGFHVDFDLGWFVSLRHAAHDDLEVALTAADHESIPASSRHAAQGVALAVIVDDVEQVLVRALELDIPVVQQPTDHPWGQRQLLLAMHDDVLLDAIQHIEPDPAWMAENGLVDPA